MNVTCKAIDNTLDDLLLDVPLLLVGDTNDKVIMNNKREKRLYGVCDTLLAALWVDIQSKLKFDLSAKFSMWKQSFSLYFVAKKHKNDDKSGDRNDDHVTGNNVDVTSVIGGEKADEEKIVENVTNENVNNNVSMNGSKKENETLVKTFEDLNGAIKTWTNMINASSDNGMEKNNSKVKFELQLRNKNLDDEFNYIKMKLYQRYDDNNERHPENSDSETELEFLINFFKQRRDIRAGKMIEISTSFNRGRNSNVDSSQQGSNPRKGSRARGRSKRKGRKKGATKRTTSPEKSQTQTQTVEEKTEDVDVLAFDTKESDVVKEALRSLKSY